MSLTSAKKNDMNRYELEVKVEKDDFQKAIDAAYKKGVKNIQMPGFRKGHAPKSVVEKMYGESYFWDEAVNTIYPTAYEAAVKEADIETVGIADVEITDITNDGFTFIAKVAVKPEIEIGEYKGLTADKAKVEISTKEVNEELDKMKERGVRSIPVEGRKIKNGDMTNIDFEGLKDGVAFDGGTSAAFDLEIGSGQFIPGFEEEIIGHEVGEEFDVNVSFPADYHVEDLADQPVVFKVKLNSATEKEYPTVDDEFAKDVSEFETLDDLKADIKKTLSEKAEKIAKDDFENALIEKIVESIEGDIPAEMYEESKDQMLRDFENRIAGQGMNMDLYLQYTGSTKEAFRDTFVVQAERQVKVRLALEKIAELEEIKTTEAELDKEYARIAELYCMDSKEVKKLVDEDMITKDIQMNKAIDVVRDSAKENLVDESTKQDKEDKKDKE